MNLIPALAVFSFSLSIAACAWLVGVDDKEVSGPDAGAADGTTADVAVTGDAANDGDPGEDVDAGSDDLCPGAVTSGVEQTGMGSKVCQDGGATFNLAISPDHCGACFNACGSGTCVSGRCTGTALPQDAGGALLLTDIDNTSLYWVNGNKAAGELAKSGAGATRHYSSTLGIDLAKVTAGGDLVIALDTGELVTVAKDGGVLSGPDDVGAGRLRDLALVNGEFVVDRATGKLRKVEAGSAGIPLAGFGTTHAIARDGNQLLVADGPADAAAEAGGRVAIYDPVAASTTKIVTTGVPTAIGSDTRYFYYASGRSIYRIKRGSAGPGDELGRVTSNGPIHDIRVGAKYVYFIVGTGPSFVFRISKCGGPPTQRAFSDTLSGTLIQIDGQKVYWTDAFGSVFQLDQ